MNLRCLYVRIILKLTRVNKLSVMSIHNYLSFVLHFLLSTLLFLILVNVAILAFAFRVDKSLAGMLARSCHICSTVLVVAVIAHAHRIDR